MFTHKHRLCFSLSLLLLSLHSPSVHRQMCTSSAQREFVFLCIASLWREKNPNISHATSYLAPTPTRVFIASYSTCTTPINTQGMVVMHHSLVSLFTPLSVGNSSWQPVGAFSWEAVFLPWLRWFKSSLSFADICLKSFCYAVWVTRLIKYKVMNNFLPWNPVYCMSDVVNACH